MKITKNDVKSFWERNKRKIIIGGSAVCGLVIGGVLVKKHAKNVNWSELASKAIIPHPTRKIPEIDGYKILDIGEDINDGCIMWFDGCRLADCGKFGEDLCKVERIDPETLITEVILAKEKLEL